MVSQSGITQAKQVFVECPRGKREDYAPSGDTALRLPKSLEPREDRRSRIIIVLQMCAAQIWYSSTSSYMTSLLSQTLGTCKQHFDPFVQQSTFAMMVTTLQPEDMLIQ